MQTQLIRLTLHDGDPEGLRSAAIAGRSTLVLACPWNQFEILRKRDEAHRPAVYFLVAPTEGGVEAGGMEHTIYIGECDSVVERFAGGHHQAAAAEWSQIFVATTSEDTFNRAHARHAEHRLVAAARQANRALVRNGGTGPGKLSDGDTAFAGEFISNVIVLAQTLGLSLFRPSVSAPSEAGSATSTGVIPEFEFAYTKQKISARMVLDGASFVVKAGSLARAMDGVLSSGTLARRAAARTNGIMVPHSPGFEKFTADYPARSTSMAGEMVYGSSCAGPEAWRHAGTGQTYRDWLAEQTASKGMV